MSSDHAAEFETQRARLMGVGYRILGSVADAEDVVQEAWLRWDGIDRIADRQRRGVPDHGGDPAGAGPATPSESPSGDL